VSNDPMNAARRKNRQRQRLGADAICVMCGQTNPDALMRIHRSLLERHHVFGVAHEPNETVIVCRNCHAGLSAAQQDDGVPLTSQATLLERGIAMVAAAGSSLNQIGNAFLEWADRAHDLVRGLDQDLAEWRRKPWSRP